LAFNTVQLKQGPHSWRCWRWMSDRQLVFVVWLLTSVMCNFWHLQGRSRRSGRSGHGRTTFSAELVLL